MADILGTSGNDAIQPFGSSLVFTLSATSAEGQWPVINVVINGSVVLSGVQITASNAVGATQVVSVPIPAGVTVSTMALQYTNDEQTNWNTEDRNLFVSSINLNGHELSPAASSYLRTADGSVVQGQSAMVWGGELDFSNLQGFTAQGSGTVSIDGLGGTDTVLFSGSASSYSITHTSVGYNVSGNGQTADMTNIERLHFSDTNIALGTDAHGVFTAELIAALFGPGSMGVPQYVGQGIALMDQGVSAQTLASLAMGTPLYHSIAGSGSNTDFVNLVYHNLFGTAPDAGTLNQYVGMLDSHSVTQAQLAVMAAESSYNQVNLVGVMDHGIAFS